MAKKDFDIDFDFDEAYGFDAKSKADDEAYDDTADTGAFTDEDLGLSADGGDFDLDGNLVQRKYVDFTVNTDERICDGFYFATALKHMKKYLQHPERLDEPLDEVVKDVD